MKRLEEKDTNMKTTRILSVLATTFAALTLVSTANAQYKPVGDDGIAASPKLRQQLSERKANTTHTVAAAPAMACPMCKDVKTTELNPLAKDGQVLAGTNTKTVIKHTCPACTTTFAVAGQGKARHTVATHTCGANVPNPATCCAMN
jgi:hypothetical protein